MTKDLSYLTRQILRLRLEPSPDDGEEAALVHSFLGYGSIYVVADPATTAEEWAQKTFGIAVQDQSIRLFLDKTDADFYARSIHANLKDGTLMVMKTTQAMVNSIISNYSRKGFITRVWLCGITPIKASTTVSCFPGGVKRDKASTITDPDKKADVEEPALGTTPPAPSPLSPPEPEPIVETNTNLQLVEEARKVLSEPSRAARRKMDPTESYLNLHWLVEKLIFANRINPIEMDERLGLVNGYTKMFISDKTKDDIPMDVAGKYLRYFGLYEFLYLFRKDCKEMREMLKAHPKLDQYEVVQAKGSRVGEEVFILTQVEQTQTKDGINVFRLTFKSPDRDKPFQMVSSTNIDMNVGNKYVLPGLEPARPLSTLAPVRGAATSGAESGPSREEMAAALAKAEANNAAAQAAKKTTSPKPSQTIPPQDMTPEEKIEADRQTVLGWIIEHKKISSKEAKEEMAKFNGDTEVIAAFAKFATSGSKAASNFGRRGYTPARLMKNLRYTPTEAFAILADLRTKPSETMQMLKYRETDPQYQDKKPNEDTDEKGRQGKPQRRH